MINNKMSGLVAYLNEFYTEMNNFVDAHKSIFANYGTVSMADKNAILTKFEGMFVDTYLTGLSDPKFKYAEEVKLIRSIFGDLKNFRDSCAKNMNTCLELIPDGFKADVKATSVSGIYNSFNGYINPSKNILYMLAEPNMILKTFKLNTVYHAGFNDRTKKYYVAHFKSTKTTRK